MSLRLLFIDAVAEEAYDERTLDRQALGGTEATVLRVARGLASRGLSVTVAQRARQEPRISRAVRYLPYEHKRLSQPSADAVVVVRAHKLLPALRRRYPEAQLYLWMHCLPGRHVRQLARLCVDTDTRLVAVSDTHLEAMRAFFERHDPGVCEALDAVRVYNPVAPELAPADVPVDPDKLLFLSSPHKGLDQVLEAYKAVRERCPTLRLHVANPGYLDWPVPECPGVIELGKLRPAEVKAELQNALCLFYPQDSFRETFGLVFAEAHAVGTPVLAHPHGAAPEVVRDPEQLCDARDFDEITRRILRWRSGRRPVACAPQRFRLERVLDDWQGLLTSGRAGVMLHRGARASPDAYASGASAAAPRG